MKTEEKTDKIPLSIRMLVFAGLAAGAIIHEAKAGFVLVRKKLKRKRRKD
tara:strand:+ start:2256 stop:2405 length:150 start_codon:yes stop_codon:yes gene_type:complete